MELIQLDIIGLSNSQTQTGAFALVLSELTGKRRLPIIIGNFEAQAIAIELEQMKPSRPLTHDIFKSFADSFSISLNQVVIYKLVEGIFFAKLICTGNGKSEIQIDTRTSDAIALAVRFKCPIYTFETILSSAGIILEDDEFESSESNSDFDDLEIAEDEVVDLHGSISILELNAELEKALENEDYERATVLRDEIKKRG